MLSLNLFNHFYKKLVIRSKNKIYLFATSKPAYKAYLERKNVG